MSDRGHPVTDHLGYPRLGYVSQGRSRYGSSQYVVPVTLLGSNPVPNHLDTSVPTEVLQSGNLGGRRVGPS